MMALGSLILSYKKIPRAQKAQNAHKRIKAKTVLNVHEKHLRDRNSVVWHKNYKTHISE